MNYNSLGSKAITSNRNIILLSILFIALLLGSVIGAKAQTVYNLDAADKVETKHTAIFNGKVFKVYANKKGRLYFETGKVSKSGKATRKYLTPAVK